MLLVHALDATLFIFSEHFLQNLDATLSTYSCKFLHALDATPLAFYFSDHFPKSLDAMLSTFRVSFYTLLRLRFSLPERISEALLMLCSESSISLNRFHQFLMLKLSHKFLHALGDANPET